MATVRPLVSRKKSGHIDAVGYKFVPSIQDTKMEFLVNMKAAKHDHGHQAVPSDLTLRVKALESLLVEKGLVDPAALDALIDTYVHKVGPRNGARVVARAWIDPAYKERLLTLGLAKGGLGGGVPAHPPRQADRASSRQRVNETYINVLPFHLDMATGPKPFAS
jgi:hypothetical protein